MQILSPTVYKKINTWGIDIHRSSSDTRHSNSLRIGIILRRDISSSKGRIGLIYKGRKDLRARGLTILTPTVEELTLLSLLIRDIRRLTILTVR